MKVWLAGLMARLLGAAGKLFGQVMTDLRNQGAFDRCVELAQVTVERLAGDHSIDNQTKRQMAMDGIARALAAENKVVRDSLIALAIELAVSASKAAIEPQGSW